MQHIRYPLTTNIKSPQGMCPTGSLWSAHQSTRAFFEARWLRSVGLRPLPGGSKCTSLNGWHHGAQLTYTFRL